MQELIGTSMGDFECLEQIGRGAHGVVFLVQSKIDNQIYVIKKIRFENLKVDKYKSVLEEVRNMRKVEHLNIIKYYNSFFDEKAMYILMEFAKGGDLHQFMKK